MQKIQKMQFYEIWTLLKGRRYFLLLVPSRIDSLFPFSLSSFLSNVESWSTWWTRLFFIYLERERDREREREREGEINPLWCPIWFQPRVSSLFCLLVIIKSRFLVEMSYKSIDVPIELLTLFFHIPHTQQQERVQYLSKPLTAASPPTPSHSQFLGTPWVPLWVPFLIMGYDSSSI